MNHITLSTSSGRPSRSTADITLHGISSRIVSFQDSNRLRGVLCRYGLGMVYYRSSRYDEAQWHFRKAIEINPCNAVLVCCEGMVRMRCLGLGHLTDCTVRSGLRAAEKLACGVGGLQPSCVIGAE
jgi:hypothetical protein